MRNSRVRAVIGVLAIFVALFATLGESESGGDSDGGGDSGGSSSEESNGGDGSGDGGGDSSRGTQESPLPLGTTVEVAAGWDLTVNSAELDGNATAAAANQFNTPSPGTQYVLVNVTILNNGDQPDTPFTNFDLSILPPSGVAIDPSFIVVDLPQQLDSTAQMQPGASATGVVPFEVPTADVAASVLLGQSLFTTDPSKDQKFLAIQ